MKQSPKITIPSISEDDLELCKTYEDVLKSRAFSFWLYHVLVEVLNKEEKLNNKKLTNKREELRKYFYLITQVNNIYKSLFWNKKVEVLDSESLWDIEGLSLDELIELENFINSNEFVLEDFWDRFLEQHLILPETVDSKKLSTKDIINLLLDRIQRLKHALLLKLNRVAEEKLWKTILKEVDWNVFILELFKESQEYVYVYYKNENNVTIHKLKKYIPFGFIKRVYAAEKIDKILNISEIVFLSNEKIFKWLNLSNLELNSVRPLFDRSLPDVWVVAMGENKNSVVVLNEDKVDIIEDVNKYEIYNWPDIVVLNVDNRAFPLKVIVPPGKVLSFSQKEIKVYPKHGFFVKTVAGWWKFYNIFWELIRTFTKQEVGLDNKFFSEKIKVTKDGELVYKKWFFREEKLSP